MKKNSIRYSWNLLKQFTITDFKLRYHGSILGYIWTLLRPLLFFSILYFVFIRFLKVGLDTPYPAIYLLVGLVLWGFFTEATTNGLTAIVSRGHLIRKINFPKNVILFAVVAGAGINFILNLCIVSLFGVVQGMTLSWNILLCLLLSFELILFVIGLMAILSALYVEYRDIAPMWEFTLQAMFYGTPILYPPNLLPHKLAQITMLNPLSQIIQDFRFLLISDKTITIDNIFPDLQYIRFVPVFLAVFVFCIGIFLFDRRAPSFAERI